MSWRPVTHYWLSSSRTHALSHFYGSSRSEATRSLLAVSISATALKTGVEGSGSRAPRLNYGGAHTYRHGMRLCW